MMAISYKLSFNISAVILCFAIMLPNVIWFATPTSNDILRVESSTPSIDTTASIFQALAIATLCSLKNIKACTRRISIYQILSISFCLIYYISWVLYYNSITQIINILNLAISPCLALAFFAIAKKNYIALISIFAFAMCHITYAVVNFGH